MSDERRELESIRQHRRLLDAVKPYTYLVEDKLLSLIRISEYLNACRVPGAFVECGTYKGGSAAVLSRFLGPDRHLWLYDSFEGMPETTTRDGEAAREWIGKCVASVADLEEAMTRRRHAAGAVHHPEGMVRRHLPGAPAAHAGAPPLRL